MRNKKAFTLIEVMVVMAIIAVLAVLIIGAITLARRTATETTHRSNAKTIQTALEGAYAKNKQYPTIGTQAAPVTFTAAVTTLNAAPYSLGVSIAASGCEGNATAGGGGQVWASAAQYSITPWTHNCGVALGATDVLSN